LPARTPLPARPVRPEDLGASLTRALGARQAARARADLDAAARAYEAERFTEALRLTRKLATAAPEVPEVRELHGLALYRLGRWPAAIVELEAFRALTGSAEEDHVLADCYRALRRWDDVDELWDELRSVSPSADVVNEGRIVVAGSLADRGDYAGAVRLLEKGWRIPPRPKDHHLRRAYALADLYERSGQTVRARELFRWLLGIDRQFADVAERSRALG
jgi:tetratricopeptide (TPR) repeat protein